MISAEEFFLEDSKEEKERKNLKKGVDGAKQVAFRCLGRAHALLKRASSGDPSPTLAGRASAYLTTFMELASVLSIKPELYEKATKMLTLKIGSLLNTVSENSQKTVIEHRRDPKGLEVEMLQAELKKKELELREIKIVDRTEKPSGAPLGAPEAAPAQDGSGMIREVSQWLSGSCLGYDKAEAERRAKAVYRPDASLEDLIAAACRL